MAIELTAFVTCNQCGNDYEGHWFDDSLDIQDMAEAPVSVQECPGCGHKQEEEYPGWSFRSEAG